MKQLTHALFLFLLKSGGLGLFLLGILDSSFLFAPFGNDLLLIALVAADRKPLVMLYYAAASAIGSVLGCLVLDLVFRQAGERGLDKHLPRKRLEYVKNKVNQSASWALVIASLAPPPFPFTAFVMAAAALEYPRRRLLTAVGAARMVRFTVVGLLALRFGRRIIAWSEKPIVEVLMVVLISVCVVGSVVSAYGWIRRSRVAKEPVTPSQDQRR